MLKNIFNVFNYFLAYSQETFNKHLWLPNECSVFIYKQKSNKSDGHFFAYLMFLNVNSVFMIVMILGVQSISITKMFLMFVICVSMHSINI